MNRFLSGLFVFLILIILAETGFFFYLNQKSKTIPAPAAKPKSQNSNSQLPKSDLFFPPEFKILYQGPNDKEGRTIIYESKTHRFSGIGEFYDHSTSPAMLIHIIGVFERWEEIEGSKDKYLILSDPINKKTLKKTRVAFEKSELFDQGRNLTRLAFERLSDGELMTKKERVVQIDQKILDDLIRKGDVLVAIPLFLFNKEGRNIDVQKDKSDIELVSWIYLRRK